VRVLVTGAAGQLGHDVVTVCEACGDDVLAADRATIDVTDRDSVMGAVTTWRPDVLINAAAWTAVDACEADPDRAFASNALSVRWLSEACERVGAHLLHVSTDYVFAGDRPEPYDEWDTPAPANVYGASKLAGEREAMESATIVRSSWVCGSHGANMVKTVLRLVGQPGPLRFVGDQIGHPTFTADLAPMLRRLALDRRRGIHHVTNQGGVVSWYEFVREIVRAAGHDPARVEQITTLELQPHRAAVRPANSVLDNAVLRLSGLPLLRDFREPLAELVRQLRA
jgi:dTDP-4-dehydrorhamnose reductase